MSFIRTAALVSIGIAVMPSDPESQSRLYERTASAVHWTLTFCDRNGATCETADRAWQTFLAKAEFAGELAYKAYVNYAADADRQPAAFSNASVEQKASPNRGTLTQDDLRPSWRQPVRRQGI